MLSCDSHRDLSGTPKQDLFHNWAPVTTARVPGSVCRLGLPSEHSAVRSILVLRNRNELQARFPQGPKAGSTQETSKYGVEQLRGQWGERVPKVVSAPRRAPLGTGCLFQGELEVRRAEAGNLEGQ